MKSRLLARLVLAALLAPALAQAHPGHDGDHELVWDFQHLASRPLATIECIVLVTAGAWGVWRLLKANLTGPRPQRIRRNDGR
jgi:hypothetical protein